MSDLVQDVCRLAADVVSAKSEYAAARTGASAVRAARMLQAEIVALAEAFYAAEALYALKVCFPRREQASPRRVCPQGVRAWKERSVYVRVAQFVAGLGPTLLLAQGRAHAALGAGTLPAGRLGALSRALAKAGYLPERLQ